VILPTAVTPTKQDNITTVRCDYEIIDIDTGQKHRLESVGQGSDMQDKGSNKALTGAYKYLLLRTFAIPTGEDPDKTSSDELNDAGKDRTKKAIMEFLDHPAFTGRHIYKGKETDYDASKVKCIEEMETMSLQRLNTRLKIIGEMHAVAYEDSVNAELGD
jgi:hypothetical protein